MQIEWNKRIKPIGTLLLAGILCLCMIMGGCQSTKKGNAPDFKVLDERGQSVSLSDYQGKPVIVNFWATWCPPCRSEMPAFDNAYKEYKRKIRFMMVNLTTWEETQSVSTVKDFLLDNGYDFPAYFDTKGDAVKKYDVGSIPTTLFVDKNGDLVYKHTGMMSEAQLNDYIEEYLL